MNWGNVLVWVMIALQVGTVLAYIFSRSWPQALYWFGAATINAAVLWQSR